MRSVIDLNGCILNRGEESAITKDQHLKEGGKKKTTGRSSNKNIPQKRPEKRPVENDPEILVSWPGMRGRPQSQRVMYFSRSLMRESAGAPFQGEKKVREKKGDAPPSPAAKLLLYQWRETNFKFPGNLYN